MVGRIPTHTEILQYQQWPQAKRRTMLIDKLLKDDGFADRWTVFFADLLRIRSRAEGGNRLLAYVHQSIESGKPWDVMTRELIASSGSAGKAPSVGFLLADDSDPMAMAAATGQIFMGVRIACAQCHNHPLEKWTNNDYSAMAILFARVRRKDAGGGDGLARWRRLSDGARPRVEREPGVG